MPWRETSAVKERAQFVRDLASGQWTMTELCEHHGVSRPTGYKWARRYKELGADGLKELSRAPRTCPHRTAAEIEEQVLLLKRTHGWGARKLHRLLKKQVDESALPCRSTVFDILKRNGLVKSRRRRQRWQHPGATPLHTHAPNEVWTIDFKGQFKTRDGVYCYPLTVLDNFSRYLLACTALRDVKTRGTKHALERLFRECGLPQAIRSDNGPPFASTGIHGLCELNVWWMKLGIVHQRIRPSSPQENGAHERMHRTLKAAATRPPAQGLRGQQWKFDRFRDEYNVERPHETLGDEAPASLWVPSSRNYPTRLASPEYPNHFELRRVSNAGHFKLGAQHHFISHALKGDYLGLEEIDDGVWNIVYYQTLLGRLDLRTGKITGATFRSADC